MDGDNDIPGIFEGSAAIKRCFNAGRQVARHDHLLHQIVGQSQAIGIHIHQGDGAILQWGAEKDIVYQPSGELHTARTDKGDLGHVAPLPLYCARPPDGHSRFRSTAHPWPFVFITFLPACIRQPCGQRPFPF